MATPAKNIDTSGLIALANEIKKLDDEGIKRSAENIFNIAKSFESFQNLKISKLEKTISGVKDYAEKLNESLLSLKVPDTIKNIGEDFGAPLLKISEGLRSFSGLSVKDIKNSFDTTSIQLFELTKTFSDTLLLQTGKDFTYLQNNFGKPLEEISEGLKAFSNLSIIRVKGNLDKIGSAFKDIIEEFGIYFSSEVNPIFTQLGYTFGEPLLKISEALKSFSELSMANVRSNLTTLGSSFKNIIEEFGAYFSGITTDDFKKLGESFGEPLTKISKGLKDFSELSINELKNNFEKLTDFTAIIKDFNAINSAAGSGVGGSLLSLFEGLEKFSKLNILKLKLNIVLLGILPGSIKKLAKTFSNLGPDLKDAGENFGEPLEKIAGGLSIFSELNIGSIFKNIVLLSVLPLNSFFKKLAKSVPDLEEAGESFGKPLMKISEGLKTFSGLNVLKLIFNAISLNVFAGLLSKAVSKLNTMGEVSEKALNSLKKFSFVDSMENIILKLGKVFKGLAKGLASSIVNVLSGLTKFVGKGISNVGKVFSNISKMVSTLILNFFTDLGKNIGKIAKGTLAIGLISASLVVFGLALKSLTGIDIASVITGTLALTTLSFVVKSLGGGGIIKGVLAIGLLSAGLFVFAKSLQQFGGVSWKDVLIGSAALAVLTAAMFGLGALVSGPQGLLFLAGIAALTGLGVSLLPAAFAFKMLGEGAQGVSKALSDITPQLSELAQIGPSLLTTAAALGVLSAALVAFSAGSLFSGGAGLFGKILGINPIDKLKELAALGDGLDKTANSLERINSYKNSAGSDLEGMKYDNSNRRTELNSEKDSMGATVVGGGSSTLNNIGGSTVNNTSINQNNIQDRTSYVLSHNMAWTAC